MHYLTNKDKLQKQLKRYKQMKYQTPITDLVKEVTRDIDNIKDKKWLKPALISHLSNHCSLPKQSIIKVVDCFFNNSNKY